MEPDSPPHKRIRRVREACDACRRKKNRCPGEKPICSYCARLGLGSACTYTGANTYPRYVAPNDATDGSSISQTAGRSPVTPHHPTLHDRFAGLDHKVTEVLGQVRLLAAAQSQPHNLIYPDQSADHPTATLELPEPDVFRKAAELFVKYCHCQPLPIFVPNSFVSTFASRDLELRLCVAGLSLRFDADAATRPAQDGSFDLYLQTARSMVMSKVTHGPVNLSTLQCLCLLALSDFNLGRHQQSGIHLSLAIELARSARLDQFCRMTSNSVRTEEHVRCLWSIVLLQYLSGGFGPLSVTIDTASLRFPSSDATNDMASTARQSSGVTQDIDHDLGVVVYGLQMSEAWHRVRHYVQQRGKTDEHPPWSGQSIYSSIMCRQMEIESKMPHRHRFKPSRFSEHSTADLTANRSYWAPWLYLQVVYHATVCALNHPILLSIHLRRFRINQVPELFLQRTADLISTHTDWIIHLLELAREKDYELTDPFLGQCIAIVATIFLQQSYSQDLQVRREKQDRFLTCLYFVQDLGRYWDYVDQMATDLQKFETTLSKAYESSLMENSPDLSNLVDLATFWKILDNTLPSSVSNSHNDMFGPSLRPQVTSRVEGEYLSTHLLPEPTRVDSVAQLSSSTVNTPTTRNGVKSTRGGNHGAQYQPMQDLSATDTLLDTPFLAQNFFALGQDFVGNANDWFNWTDV